MRVSSAERGGLSMMSRSGGLKDRAVAGRPNQTTMVDFQLADLNENIQHILLFSDLDSTVFKD